MRVSRSCEPALVGSRPEPRVAGRAHTWAALLLVAGLGLGTVTDATAEYWNLFNIEGESSIGAAFVTYASFNDMLHDSNRLTVIVPSASASEANAIGTGTDGSVYWNVFNIEGESSIGGAFVTYATRDDMLRDANRLEVVIPNSSASEANIVDAGSDGQAYWSLFNIEGESSIGAAFVTYATRDDMLHDRNRLAVVAPRASASEANVVGTGSDGQRYWNVFNIEGESSIGAAFVTYATLDDMLQDTNRLEVIIPNAAASEANLIGAGADILPSIPEPSTTALMLAGVVGITVVLRRRR